MKIHQDNFEIFGRVRLSGIRLFLVITSLIFHIDRVHSFSEELINSGVSHLNIDESDDISEVDVHDKHVTDKDVSGEIANLESLPEDVIRNILEQSSDAGMLFKYCFTTLVNIRFLFDNHVWKNKVVNLNQLRTLKLLDNRYSENYFGILSLNFTRADITPQDIEWILMHTKLTLEDITLARTRVSNKSVLQILQHCGKLKTIDLSGCRNISADILVNSDKELFLEYADFSRTCISKVNVQRILLQSPDLKYLHLDICMNLPPDVFMNFRKELKSLDTLSIINTRISDGSLMRIIECSPNLRVLNIVGCRNITERVFSILNLKKLEFIDMRDTRIPENIKNALRKRYPHMIIL